MRSFADLAKSSEPPEDESQGSQLFEGLYSSQSEPSAYKNTTPTHNRRVAVPQAELHPRETDPYYSSPLDMRGDRSDDPLRLNGLATTQTQYEDDEVHNALNQSSSLSSLGERDGGEEPGSTPTRALSQPLAQSHAPSLSSLFITNKARLADSSPPVVKAIPLKAVSFVSPAKPPAPPVTKHAKTLPSFPPKKRSRDPSPSQDSFAVGSHDPASEFDSSQLDRPLDQIGRSLEENSLPAMFIPPHKVVDAIHKERAPPSQATQPLPVLQQYSASPPEPTSQDVEMDDTCGQPPEESPEGDDTIAWPADPEPEEEEEEEEGSPKTQSTQPATQEELVATQPATQEATQPDEPADNFNDNPNHIPGLGPTPETPSVSVSAVPTTDYLALVANNERYSEARRLGLLARAKKDAESRRKDEAERLRLLDEASRVDETLPDAAEPEPEPSLSATDVLLYGKAPAQPELVQPEQSDDDEPSRPPSARQLLETLRKGSPFTDDVVPDSEPPRSSPAPKADEIRESSAAAKGKGRAVKAQVEPSSPLREDTASANESEEAAPNSMVIDTIPEHQKEEEEEEAPKKPVVQSGRKRKPIVEEDEGPEEEEEEAPQKPVVQSGRKRKPIEDEDEEPEQESEEEQEADDEVPEDSEDDGDDDAPLATRFSSAKKAVAKNSRATETPNTTPDKELKPAALPKPSAVAKGKQKAVDESLPLPAATKANKPPPKPTAVKAKEAPVKAALPKPTAKPGGKGKKEPAAKATAKELPAKVAKPPAKVVKEPPAKMKEPAAKPKKEPAAKSKKEAAKAKKAPAAKKAAVAKPKADPSWKTGVVPSSEHEAEAEADEPVDEDDQEDDVLPTVSAPSRPTKSAPKPRAAGRSASERPDGPSSAKPSRGVRLSKRAGISAINYNEDTEDEEDPEAELSELTENDDDQMDVDIGEAGPSNNKRKRGPEPVVKKEKGAKDNTPRPTKRQKTFVSSGASPAEGGVRVFALYRGGHYYPGTVFRAKEDTYTVSFDIGMSAVVKLVDIVKFKLRKGDNVVLISTGRSAVVREAENDEQVFVNEIRLPNEERIAVAFTDFYILGIEIDNCWENRKLKAVDIPVKKAGVKPTPTKQVAGARLTTKPANRKLAGTAFIVTMSPSCDGQTYRNKVESAIKTAQGEVLGDWESLLSFPNASGNRWLATQAQFRWIGPGNLERLFVVAESYHTKPKFLLALALGVPCLNTSWLEAVNESDEGTAVPWSNHLLPQGYSKFYRTSVSQFVNMEWGTSPLHLTKLPENRVASKLFADDDVLLVGQEFVPNKKEVNYGAISKTVLAMGARSVEAVTEKSLAGQPLTSYRYIVVSDSEFNNGHPWPEAEGEEGPDYVSSSWVKDVLFANRLLEIEARS